MGSQTSVNEQITDAVTQSNVKVLADAPAMAMSSLYQATAGALANAAYNATNSQQQMSVTLQALATAGVAKIYSLDTAANGIGTEKVGEKNKDSSPNLATTAPLNKQLEDIIESTNTELQEQSDASASEVNKLIKDAVKFALDCNLGSADAFHHAVREVMSAYATSLQELANIQHSDALDAIKLAATTSALKSMIEAPDQTEKYVEILSIIKAL